MRIAVWGPLVLTTDEREIGPRDFPGIKPKQLLEILVMERGHAVSKARLADLLWPDQAPQNHVATLETYVSVLRQALQPGVRAGKSVILTEHGGYRLDVNQVTVDLDEFDELVRQAAGAEPVAALASLGRALRLIRGQVLEDESSADWAEQLRNTYRLRQVQVLIDAGRLSLLTGEPTAALGYAEEAVAINSLAEAAYQVLMTAAYSLWRQDEALNAFERCRRLLAEELGADPLDETVALHLAILRHEDVASLLPRVPVQEPMHQTSSPEPGSTPLLGRRGELDRLTAAARQAMTGQFSLLLVVGEPGIGKTRLVRALAERLAVPTGFNRCSDLESKLPYVALALALRPVLAPGCDDVTPVLSDLLRRADEARPFDEFARLRAMEDLAKVLTTADPFLLILDDVQWADEETLTTLGYLRRRSAGARAVVVLTCSRDALQHEGLRNLEVDLRIDLDVLSAEDLTPIGERAISDITGGHPMFVAGWLEAREQGLPELFPAALRERVITRCWDLGPQAYRLLTAASVLEPPIRPDLLAALVGASVDDIADELDRLVDHRLLVATAQGFRFRHAPERQLLSETMSPVRREMLLQRASAFADGPPRRRSTDESRVGRRMTDRAGDGPRETSLVLARAVE